MSGLFALLTLALPLHAAFKGVPSPPAAVSRTSVPSSLGRPALGGGVVKAPAAAPTTASLALPPLLPAGASPATLAPAAGGAPTAASVLAQGFLEASAAAQSAPGPAHVLASASFDRSARARPRGRAEAVAVPASAPPALPSYLVAATEDQTGFLAEVVDIASRSKTGRRVLSDIRKLSIERGRPMILMVGKIASGAQYAWNSEVITVHVENLEDPWPTAGMLMHELQHALQFARELPADSLEMEIEAYLVQFRVSEEIGYVAKRGTFEWSALARLRNDVGRFVAWLRSTDGYAETLSIIGAGLSHYERELERRRKNALKAVSNLEARAAEKKAAIAAMRRAGHPEALIEQYRIDEVEPGEIDLRWRARDLAWIERDLARIRSPRTRALYQTYARRVREKARRYHAHLNR